MCRCGSGLNRHLSDRQSDALPLSYRSEDGKRPLCGRLPSVFHPPVTRRKAGTLAARQLPRFLHKRTCLRSSHTCTIRYLSRLTLRVIRIASPLFPTYRELGRPDLPGVTEHIGSAKCITAFLSRRCRRLAAPGRYTRPRPRPMILNVVEHRGFEPRTAGSEWRSLSP